jgi:hypothetical protein
MKNTLLTFITVVFTLASIGSLITVNSSTLSNYLSFTAAKTASYSASSEHSQRVWKTTGDVGLVPSDNHFMLSKCTEGDLYVREKLTGSISDYSDNQVMQVIRDSNQMCN